MTRYVVIGGGIVGLATARALGADDPDAQITVLEKADRVAAHQSGHNSGVVHTGIAYAPGSLKAQLCTAGARSILAFAAEHDVPFSVRGKLIVATAQAELAALATVVERGEANGVAVRRLTPDAARELEPNVSCLGAVHVPSTAVIDFRVVSEALARELVDRGAEVTLGSRVHGIRTRNDEVVVESTTGEVEADVLLNCAGLGSDRIARLAGAHPAVRIVPFRGEYFALRPERAELVRGLIYPVADPALPFLGVHLTRGVDDVVHAGPNAVLALAREGYGRGSISARDLADVLTYQGFWRLARRHAAVAVEEVRRSWSAQRFAASAARLVPGITADDLEPAGSGVRAQAVRPDGTLVEDFLVARNGRTLHVLNAPSPAATSSLEIGAYVARLARRLAPEG